MKLLFDANLSPRLVRLISDLFPSSAHVEDFGDLAAEDGEIWAYALQNKFTIVTKDADFDAMSRHASNPPKIIWIRRGNCSTSVIANMIRANSDAIASLEDEENELSVLVLL